MEHLIIPGTENTLDVHFDPESGLLSLSGSSFPENAIGFFQPLIDWLEEYARTDSPVRLDMRFNYLNSGSIKCLLSLLRVLGEYHERGGQVTAFWRYPEEDEDIGDLGARIARLTGLPIELTPIS